MQINKTFPLNAINATIGVCISIMAAASTSPSCYYSKKKGKRENSEKRDWIRSLLTRWKWRKESERSNPDRFVPSVCWLFFLFVFKWDIWGYMQLSSLPLSLSLGLSPFWFLRSQISKVFQELSRPKGHANRCSMRLVKINKQMQEKLMFVSPIGLIWKAFFSL